MANKNEFLFQVYSNWAGNNDSFELYNDSGSEDTFELINKVGNSWHYEFSTQESAKGDDIRSGAFTWNGDSQELSIWYSNSTAGYDFSAKITKPFKKLPNNQPGHKGSGTGTVTSPSSPSGTKTASIYIYVGAGCPWDFTELN